jgi:hypothetical protein
MEKGMDRNLRLATINSPALAGWIRACLLALAVAGIGLALGSARPALAQDAVSGQSMSVPLAADAPSTYTVKKGDTLWDISGVFLRDPWYWPEIWYVNPSIENPHLIYPGDVLQLVYVDGQPRVTIERAGAMRLSPQVRSEPLKEAVRAIPYDLLMDFVGRPAVLSRDEVRNMPYVVGVRDRHLVGAMSNEIYARNLSDAAPGARYTIMHVGDELRDPDDGDLLGYMGYYAATARIITESGKDRDKFAHLTVVESGREILQGDKLLPAGSDFGDDIVISQPENEKIDGEVIAVHDGVQVAGRYQVLVINRGKRDGLAPGNALAVFKRGENVRDYAANDNKWTRYAISFETARLPNERGGTLLLFKVYDRMSYGLVVESVNALRVGDGIRHPSQGHKASGSSDFKS